MAAMNIYLKVEASQRFLLMAMLLMSFAYLGLVVSLWVFMPFHLAMIPLTVCSVICLLATMSLLFFPRFPYPIFAIIYFTFFICPVVMCLFAIILTAGANSMLVIALPYLALAYSVAVTDVEYSGVNFGSLPRRVTRKPFEKSSNGDLVFNPHISVLFLSPWRNDDSFFFAGKTRRVQKVLVAFLFAYMMIFFCNQSSS